MTEIPHGLVWWITVIDLPAMAGLFWMVLRVRSEAEDALQNAHVTLDRRCDQLRDALHGFKLEAAKNYASRQDMHALEKRLVEHLLRIEAKLEYTALKTEGLSATKD